MDANLFNVNSINQISKNPYENNLLEEPKTSKQKLNDYDSNLLNEKKEFTQNESFKISFQITEKQKELSDINSKIKNAELYGTANEVLNLRVRKQRIENELQELTKQQHLKNATVTTLTNEIAQLQGFRKIQLFLSKNILSKFSKRYNAIAFLGESLETLSSINRSVDALLEMNTPIVDKKDNYEKLTHYLNKANQIHSQIARNLKNI